ncbi:adenylate kinase [Thioclava sp. GXIMD4216]|uniref:Adenylate kinase n=1 Tax=Thioclava litoralis TaxID=3076557 RepID=A0ABZ1E0T5_9RHOB|nr:adenylate kinase [Thioclava sp. FTW29]
MKPRIYITGAAGAGSTSLGQKIAQTLQVPYIDTDDCYWAETEVPFTCKREIGERCALIEKAQGKGGPEGGWVLAGAADGWGDAILRQADLVIFLRAPTPLRLTRLRKREVLRYGTRVAPGGDMEQIYRTFLNWAASYDDPYFCGRSLNRHRDWLESQPVPVLELSGARPIAELEHDALAELEHLVAA